MTKAVDRCTGACCERFPMVGIGHTVEEIRQRLQRDDVIDGKFIADMIVPIEPIVAGTQVRGGVADEEPSGGGWFFTCRHFDAKERQCSAYRSRPAMCRDYPYGQPCEHGENCTWDLGRAGLWPSRDVHYEYGDDGRRRVHLSQVERGV